MYAVIVFALVLLSPMPFVSPFVQDIANPDFFPTHLGRYAYGLTKDRKSVNVRHQE